MVDNPMKLAPQRLVKLAARAIALILFGSAFSLPTRAQLLESTGLSFGEASFPNDWYVNGGEGLESLRKLEGQSAKELSVAEWKGAATTLAELKGKVVVLDFWATWCGPCMALIPKNIEFVEKYKDRGVALIGIHDAKSGWSSADKVISEKGINYPVALDNTQGDQGEMTQAYQLKFWPTYFVIDRNGILRAAAIKPEKIEEVVLQLLGESPLPGQSSLASQATALPPAWFLGGDKRLNSLRAAEGKKASELVLGQWIGNEPDREGWEQQVRVVQFVRPELTASVDQLSKLQAVSERFSKQGVVFVAVCDARSSPDRMLSVAEEKRIAVPIAVDGPVQDGNSGIGATANLMGIKFAPNTIVIDRRGILRAAGLKPDFLDKVLNQLLAEQIPMAAEPSEEPSQVVPDKTPEPKISVEVNTDTTISGSVIDVVNPDEGQPPSPRP